MLVPMTLRRPLARVLLPCCLALAGCGPTEDPAPREPSGPGAEAPAPGRRPAPAPAREPRLPADGLVAPAELGRYLGLDDPPLLVDVRTAKEFEGGHIPGALGVPVQELPRRLAELAAGRERGAIVYGRSGRRSRSAIGILANAGFTELARLDGDVMRWENEGRELVREEE